MSRRAALLSLALVAGGLVVAGGNAARAQPAAAVVASADPAAKAAAFAAADRILATLRDGDANARYSQFSDELKRISSPSMVAATMRQQPRLISWTILSVNPGISTTAVEAELRTSAGQRQIELVLTRDGKLAGYHLERSDEPATKVALAFVKALSGGQFISASSYLGPSLATDLTPSVLQERWLNLQRLTGLFLATDRASVAENTPDQKLVLVTTRFTRLTDRLFIILDTNNRIIGIDFPRDAAPTAVAR